MVLTAYFALSLVIGLFVTIARVMRSIITNLTPTIEASGPHDFAVRKVSALVSSATRVHRIPTLRP
jgi:hypothetical protein